ncbi:hypothetical protein [Umezawaea beigongshangensis]|uniref:hypothetical protein n=1 Tax=Umezawaea beigongshangensis TaxID=2780383 RepID=UPI0018F19139|nr:hypothetical protein [Umezawaea beigongshangensis]
MSSGRRRVLVGLALGLATGAVAVTIALHTGTRPVEARRVDRPPVSAPALSATHTTSVVGVGVPQQEPEQEPGPATSSVPAPARSPVTAEPVTTPVTTTTGPTTGEAALSPPASQVPPTTSPSSPSTSLPADDPTSGRPSPPWFPPLPGPPWHDHCSLLHLELSSGRYDQDGRDLRLLRICLG